MHPTDKRNHKVKCHYGVKDYLAYYKETAENTVDDKVFRAILKDYFLMNKNLISTTAYTFNLPEQMGKIEVRKMKREVVVDDDGKIINKLPINWKATNQLWKEDARAKEKKVKLRYPNEHTQGFVFFPVFIKNNATFKKKSLFRLQINRDIGRNMYNSIMSHEIDAFLLF